MIHKIALNVLPVVSDPDNSIAGVLLQNRQGLAFVQLEGGLLEEWNGDDVVRVSG